MIGREREPLVSDKPECDFIEAVVMEALRLLPPAPFLLPHVNSEDAELDGYFIKAKTQVFLLDLTKLVDLEPLQFFFNPCIIP